MHQPAFTLEERARLSDEEALRRHFDARNLRVLRWASWPFVALALGLFVYGLTSGLAKASLGGLALITALLSTFILQRAARGGVSGHRLDPLVRFVSSRARAFTLGFLALQYTLDLGVTFGGHPVLPTIFAWFTVAFLFLAPETVSIYLWIAALVTVEAAIRGTFSVAAGDASLWGVLPNVALAMALALWLGRRARLHFLQQWHGWRTEATEQLRIRDELGFARELQLSMLPREAPPVPWIEAAAISLPATEVGGDYYDYFVVDADRLVAVTGDVAGHGIASGIVLSGVRSGLALLGDELSEPFSVMRRLHRMVRQTMRHRMLVSLSIVLFDRARGIARLTAAAHPPLFVRRASGAVERVDTSSLPLGNGLGESFDEREIVFAAGDTFVLQTDGVYETTSPGGDSYGFSRLERALAAAGGSAAAIRDAILRDLWSFKGAAPQTDDVTIVVIKIM